MSNPDDVPPVLVDEDSRTRASRPPGKEKRRRRCSRSKQKEITDPQYTDLDYPDDDGNNSNSSTPKYERPEDLAYPSGRMVCALCYCGEKSLLGQGDLTRYSPTSGFNPFKKPPLRARGSRELIYGSSPGSNSGSQEGYSTGEKVTKTAAQRRGSKNIRETVKALPRHQEYVDELSTVGCSEMLDVAQVFEATGHVTAHHCCASWSEGVTQNESYDLLCVDKAVHAGMSQRCHYCSRYGATIKCRAPKCERLFHYPCAAGSGCFQDIKSMSLLCTDHLELAPTIADPDELNCAVCDSPGQISDLLFCTSCGHHYHGDCLRVDVNPVVRAGWQCPECKICQTCRQPGDDNKMLVCDVCDKGYHTFCLVPAMTFIPKNGWCCKTCRRCTDCGSRTPGNGPSSRWHINYQVCDSCYQIRNKGHMCPVCSRAYRNTASARAEMTQCSQCEKYVHWSCEDESFFEFCQKKPPDYKCPKCRTPVSENVGQASMGSQEDKQPAQAVESEELSFDNPQMEGIETEKSVPEMVEIKTEPMAPATSSQGMTSPLPVPRKRASTSSSMGSEKGNFALKGSSHDPMLYVGEDSSIVDSHSLGKFDLASPPRKVRHISSDEALSNRDKANHPSSAESNLSSLFTDENAQDAMSLFGVDTLPQSGSRSMAGGAHPPEVLSPDAKTIRISDGFVLPTQPKVSLSPLPLPYGSPPPTKPPGPGIGKPGTMFGKGKPFGHKRKPASAKSRGKGKGKGQKRGSFTGPRKKPRGGKSGVTTQPTERNFPRRARRTFQKQVSATPSMGEETLASPIAKMEPALQIAQADDEYGDSMHNTVVLCSTEDTFTLSQDMCVVCGSFGKGPEGRLIACSQCGQCYHPFCVNLKLTKVVLRKGWRCLDCTVCEECGQVDDPAHLLLCDDCDISYHTHCLKPPLQHVPKGGWKCKWCVRCVHCGTTSPGKNSEWAANYTSCGPCASLNHCPKCRRSYKDEDIIMQCGTCDRWLHAVCECLFTESDIEKVLEKGYECCFCRPKDAIPPHQMLENQASDQNFDGLAGLYAGRTRSEVETVKEYHKDCTALTIAGLQHIQRQMQQHMGLYKKRPAAARGRNRKPSDNQEKFQAPPPMLPTLESIKAKEPSLGQPINVAAAVTALQEPSEIYRKISVDGTRESTDGTPVAPLQLPVSTGAAEDLPSGTATATEDSGMEGIERDLTPIRPAEFKSPVVGIDEVKTQEFVSETASSQDPTKAMLGVQQGGIKRRRKPYRPGIGGFTLRQRGRGGLFKSRRRRSMQPLGQSQNTSEGSKTTDAATTDGTSDANLTSTPGHGTPLGIADPNAPTDGSLPVASGVQFTAPSGTDPLATVVSPIKTTTPSTSSKPRRKKKPKLIDQFPPYLQDAFFGKDILTAAENKANAMDNMSERPASPVSGYGPKQGKHSRLVLPDRLTQRLEAQAAAAAQGNAKSQRHPSQPQDEESMLMDRENEQELLGVLPDLPFKDVELLGMIQSELKQEHGPSDSHENILSPSSLEKMVRDGFDGLQDSDVAAFFSDVLSHQGEGNTKQESHSGVQESTHHQKQSQPTHSMHQDSQQNINNVQRQQSTMQMQQAAVTGQQQTEQQRQMAIQQELQQLEIKQQLQQQRQHIMQRQMSQPAGFNITQDQNIQNQSVMNLPPGRGIQGPNITTSPHAMSLHIDPSRPRSHHTTPVMSPVPTHPMAGLHPGQSPHATPPPQPMYSRQTSMPILTGMQNQNLAADSIVNQQLHQQSSNQIITHQIPQSPGPHTLQSHPGTAPALPAPSKNAFQSNGVMTRPGGHFPDSTPANLNLSFPQQQMRMPNQQQQITQQLTQAGTPFHGPTEPPRMPLPPEGYIVSTSSTVSTSQSTVPTSTHKRSSSVPVVAKSANGNQGVVTSAAQQNVQVNTSETVATASPQVAQGQTSEGVLVPPQLPNLLGDTAIFEPSPPPWPLGTELDGESTSVNQRNIQKWEKDEHLGDMSTISPVLFANVKYPELKKEFPDWPTRAKQIAKLWRKATPEERAPFLSKAKDNRALSKSSRLKKDDQSKTPTPPMVSEDGDSKAMQEALKVEKPEDGQALKTQPGVSSDQQSVVTSQTACTTASTPPASTEYSFAKPTSRTTTPKPTSPASAQISSHPDVQQQPKVLPASAYFADQSTNQSSTEQDAAKIVQAKTERRVSIEAGVHSSSPYPQSKTPIQTPTLQESPTKAAGVTRSLSVGAALTGATSATPPIDPHNRRLSVDSQMLQIPPEQDIKPAVSISPTQARARQHMYQPSRRARLFDHSQPPPPYPAGSSNQGQGFIYQQIGPRGQVVQISTPRGVLSPGGTQAFIRTPSPGLHGTGMLAFPFDGTGQHGVPPGHPMGQPRPRFPGGVHRVQGFKGQNPPGPYIELRHTNQSDPATRRQNILRMGNPAMASGTPPMTQSSPQTSAAVAIPPQVKTEVQPPEPKSDDPFAGGHMPQDEHLDALLRSEEFKDLHFQGPQTTSTATEKPLEVASTTTTASVTLVSQPVTKSTTLTEVISTKETHENKGKCGKDTNAAEVTVKIENQQQVGGEKLAKDADVSQSKDVPTESETFVEDTPAKEVEPGKGVVEDASAKEVEPGKAVVDASQMNSGTSETAEKDVDHTPKDQGKEEVLKAEHSYSKTDESAEILRPSQPAESVPQKEADVAPSVAGSKAIEHEGPRGVGLTPPPEPQVGFIPTEESLTVSNVITVPGTSPVTQIEPVKSPQEGSSGKDTEKMDESEKEQLTDETQDKSKPKPNLSLITTKDTEITVSSAYELSPLPKSPIAPPMVQKLSKFAKIPDPPSSTMKEGEQNENSEKNENLPQNSSEEKMDVDTQLDGAMVPESEKSQEVENVDKPQSEISMETDQNESENIAKTDEPSTDNVNNASAAPVVAQQVTSMDESSSAELAVSAPQEKKLVENVVTGEEVNTAVSVSVADVTTGTSMSTSEIDPKALATVLTPTLVPSMEHDQNATSQNSSMASESTITVVHTSIATVTAYKKPLPSQSVTALTPTLTTTVPATQSQQPGQQLISPETPQTTAAVLMSTDVLQTPTRPVGSQSIPPNQPLTPSLKDDAKTTPPRQKPLLIKEQPLLLQELLEEEKREQEKARREKMRHTQTLMQQQVGVPQPGISPSVYTIHGTEMDKVTPEAGIDTIKMEFLSRMNQAAQVGLSVPPTPAEGTVSGSGATAMHQQPQAWAGHMTGHQQAGNSSFGNETELRKYRNWLIQQQHLMQMQVQKQEQLVQMKKTRKQSLMKKRNLYKRNNKEFSQEDAEELKLVTKQYTEAQQQLEKLRNDQKQHAELIQDFNVRQRHMIGSMPAGAPATLVQQQPQMTTGMGQTQQQQQILIQQHPVATPMPQQQPQQMIAAPYQTQGLQPGTQQQIVMMQPGQQQVIIQSIPASTNITGMAPTPAVSVAMGIQQQPQVVMTSQPHQQQAIVAQFQKTGQGIRPTNPAQLQQIMISQRQLQQQQQLQQIQQQKIQQQQQQQQQQVIKTGLPRSQFLPPQSVPPTPQTTVAVTGTGNQTHDAFMQMQMQQLMALQIEQQQQMAFQQNSEKPKPKRKRRKKKSQAEKEEEEQQALLAQQQQLQQQAQIRGPTPPAVWQQRPPVPMPQQAMIQSQQAHPRFPNQAPVIAGFPPGVTQMPQPHTPRAVTPTVASTHPLNTPTPQPPPQTPTSQTPMSVFNQVGVTLPTNVPMTPTGPNQLPANSAPSCPLPQPSIALTSHVPSQLTAVSPMVTPVPKPTLPPTPPVISGTSIQTSVTPVSAIAGPKVVTSISGPVENRMPVVMSTPPTLSSNTATPPRPTSITYAPVATPSTAVPSGPGITQPSILTPRPTTTITPNRPQSGRSTPRTQSPGHSVSHEGLSEAEIAILLAHDPDLIGEAVTPTVPVTVSTPQIAPTTPDGGDKTLNDDEKKKRPKKGYVMNQKTVHSIDNSIENVIRLSSEYEDKLQAAKGQAGAPVTPSPWELEPKPTKFPPKKTPETHMLVQDTMKGMLGQHPVQFTAQGLIQGMPPDIMSYGQLHQGMGMGIMPFPTKPLDGNGEPGQKKKRARKSSKEVGPDGKPVKRRPKKSRKNSQQQQFQITTMVDANMPGVMMQAVRNPLQGGKPRVMAPMVPFQGGIVSSGALTVGQISSGQPGTTDVNKMVPQWKPLPLLTLMEPEIRRSHHMCVPKGTGITECKNFVKGLLGEIVYDGVPDYYDLMFGLSEKLKKARPPTPPSSHPTSPNKNVSLADKPGTSVAKTEPTMQDPNDTTRYGPLGLSPSEKGSSTNPQPMIKVPDSLPTPPHHGIDDKDDVNLARLKEEVFIPPSSPEMEAEDDWSQFTLASLKLDDVPLISKTSLDFKEKMRDLPSPTVPIMSCQKLSMPGDAGRGFRLNDKDAVSVTVEFDHINIESIEQKLMLLSKILEAPIFSYTMMKTIKPDKKLKEALNRSIKDEQQHNAALAVQASQPEQPSKTQSDDSTLPQQRTCTYCGNVVTGNGVRRPEFKGSVYDEDVLYCNKDCYLKAELFERKVPTTPTKKKFKASHVYQRHTQKINMETLLEKFPEDEPVTPSKYTRSTLENFIPSGVQDPLKGLPLGGRGRGRRRGPGDEPKLVTKKWRGVKWKKWSVSVSVVKSTVKPPVDVEALLTKYGCALKAPAEAIDKRVCVFCGGRGDGDTHTIARLLNVDVDRWVHLNCALWSAEVYETQGGALINVDLALRRSESVLCCLCQKKGATIHCHRPRCINTYHCQCALDIKCAFFKDKTVLCPTHAPKPGISPSSTGFNMHQHHHSGDTLRSLAVYRKVYVQRPETKQIASIMQQGELTQGEKNYVLRVGALIFENVGQLATHQMSACHTKTAIYPIGYKATRLYWSPTNMRRRCKYECSITELDGKPLFSMTYKPALPGKNKPEKIVTHSDTISTVQNLGVNGLWMEILTPLEKLRSQHSVLKLFPAYINGEKLFGLTAPVVSRILESLPNIELCAEYKFRYGRTPLLEVPLAINPTGCARSEPHIKQHRKKPHTLISNLISEYYESSGIGDASSLYGKQFVHSKSSQYRRMKSEWRCNVYLARSRIQGLGLFAARDIEPGTMVIEYIGDIIRTEVSEKREKMYEAANRGVYMFRLDSDHIVDATVTGGPARYINHSCKPNCVAEVVNFEKEKKIMIVSNRHILKGEELSYDYKFDFEDEGRKIPCLCGASNCKKWMN